jgi:phospholipid/cholesterol/gamma-HCH transport system substrate-binding protein
MQEKEKQNIQLGLFVGIGLLILVLGIYMLGKQKNIFSRSIHVNAVFHNVKGLKTGNNVRFSGINVGTVTSIDILNDSAVLVSFVIKQDVQKFIKKDAQVSIGTEGLMGNKVVSIIPGTTGQSTIEGGHTFKTIEPIEIDDILTELKKSSENTTVLTRNISEITSKINRGEGIFGKLFTDTTFTKGLDDISKNTSRLTKHFADIAHKLNNEEGILGKMLSDSAMAKNFSKTIIQIENTSEQLSDISQKLNNGDGALGKIISDKDFVDNLTQAGKYSKEIADNLNQITTKINQGEGLANEFLEDKQLVDSLRTTIHNINQSAKKIGAASEALKESWLMNIFRSNEKQDD